MNENLDLVEILGIASLYLQCIPYNDETAPLLGTDKDFSEFYKIW